MPIDLECRSCRLRMQLPDDAPAKQINCPNCGSVIAATSTDRPANPFRETADSVNPYEATEHVAASSANVESRTVLEAKSKVMAPAILMLLFAGLIFMSVAINVVFYGVGFENLGAELNEQQKQQFEDPHFKQFMWVFLAIMGAPCPIIAFGAFQMLRLGNKAWSYAASICCILPLTGGCCVFTLPIGVWRSSFCATPW